jgi:hypothetical protein
VDPEEKAGRARERAITARERLRFRVYSAVRDVGLRTELFRTHPELHEPEISVNVYAQLVDVNASLTEGQIRLLREKVRPRDLNRFAEELRDGIRKAAESLQLEFTLDPARFGGSQPVVLVDVPSGYRAVLLRREPE